jgi:hypothetical protein
VKYSYVCSSAPDIYYRIDNESKDKWNTDKKSRGIVLVKGVKGDRTGVLPVVYAVGLHDIEESLLSHTVLFLNKKRRKITFPDVFFRNGKLPFFVLSSTLRINILKAI